MRTRQPVGGWALGVLILLALSIAGPVAAQPRGGPRPAPAPKPPAKAAPDMEKAKRIEEIRKRLDTDQAEMLIGRQNYAQVLAQMGGPWKNSQAEQRVQRVGAPIVQRNTRRPNLQYTFTLVDSAEMNAGSLMGGYIFLTRGLLATHNDHELAGVLAHEIAHVEAGHGRKQMIEALLASRLIEQHLEQEDRLIAEGARLAIQQAMAGHTRDMEREADQLAVMYLIHAGYSPLGLISSIWKIAGGPLVDAPLPPTKADGAGSRPTVVSLPKFSEGLPVPRATSPSRGTPGFTGYVYVPVGRQAMYEGSSRGIMRLFSDHPPLEERLDSVCELTQAARIFVPQQGPYFPGDDPDPRETDPGLFDTRQGPRAKLHANGIMLCFPWGELSVRDEDRQAHPVWEVEAPKFSTAGLAPMFASFNAVKLQGLWAFPSSGLGDILVVLKKQQELREMPSPPLTPSRGATSGRWGERNR